MNSKISIIIPVYNGDKSLKSTLRSVVEQEYDNWELLVINDGSRDKSEEIINSFLTKDSRIKIFNQSNSGVVEARKNGIEKADGEFLFFLDADDQLPKEALKILMSQQKETKADIICGAHKSISKKSTNCIVPKMTNNSDELELIKAILKGDMLSTMWGNLYKKELFDSIENYPMLKIGEDLCLNLLLVTLNKPSIAFTEKIVYNYYVHENSVMQNSDRNSGLARMSFLTHLEKFLNEQGILNSVKQELGFRFTQILVWLIFNNQTSILRDKKLETVFLDYFEISRPILLPFVKKICQLHFFSPVLCQLIIKYRKR